jgi:hypothetical protein
MNDSRPPKPRRRWYDLSPDRFIIGLLALAGLLLLFVRFQWPYFHEWKFLAVLFAFAIVFLAVVLKFLWYVAHLLFRRRPKFSIRSLLVLVVVAAVPCWWFGMKMRQAERQREAVQAIQEVGGGVSYDYQHTSMMGHPPGPAWLRRLLGDDFFADVRSVYFLNVGDVGDESLQHLESLRNLRLLSLDRTQVSDDGLEHLRGMNNLEQLNLSNTRITDAGLQHLKGLTNLSSLDLRGTEVTDEGIEKLRQALPTCRFLP